MGFNTSLPPREPGHQRAHAPRDLGLGPHKRRRSRHAGRSESGWRLSEFIADGTTAATVSRMERKGLVRQISRGLYQLPDAPLDPHHALAAAAKLVPRGVICLDSALAFHELTETAPRRVCIAIGLKEWEPRIAQPPVEIVRFGPQMLKAGTRTHLIAGVSVNIYKPAKTVADLFHYALRQGRDGPKADVSRALQAMKEGLRLGKATPAEIARYADQAGIWSKVQPYLEAMTVEG
jgi:predicted transcriptional regulator of viral defense system